MDHQTVSMDELLDALLTDAPAASPAAPKPAWLTELTQRAQVPGMEAAELCEIAAEVDPRGRASTVAGMFEGLALRCRDDATALAMLAALQHYHLPMLLESAGR